MSIAATALHLKLPLMTRNIKDFQKVPHLQLFNVLYAIGKRYNHS